MKVFKSSRFLPAVLVCAFIYGCGGGGGGSSGGTVATPCTPTLLTTSSKLKISVKQNGIYVITPNTLKQFCLDPSGISLSSFKLQNYDPALKRFFDIPVNIDLQGNLEFYGVGVNRNDYTAPNADYTETNVYWLIPATTSSPQLTMAFKTTASSGTTIPAMTTLHVENNNVYWPDMLNGAGLDHWFWKDITISTSFLNNFSVSNYDVVSTQPVVVSASLQSKTQANPLQMSFNGGGVVTQPLGWSTTSPYMFTTTPATGFLLNNGVNALQVNTTTGSSDSVFLNWFEIEYPGKALNDQIVFHGDFPVTGNYSFSISGFTQSSIELFDISNPKIPLKFSNSSAVSLGNGYQLTFSDTLTVSISNNYIGLTPAQRKTPANITLANGVDVTPVTGTYDYLIITHENFSTNIQPLKAYRTSSGGGGHTVYIAKIGDVYDSYSGGIFTPQAIKDFLKSAYSVWGAQYVSLVGDASVDYKNYLGYGEENYVPTFLMEYSKGQTPSDYWFVQSPNCMTSIVSSCVPIMAIGRLPAKTGTEADTMVNKIINYKKPSTPSWNQNVVFVAANGSLSGGEPYESYSDQLISGFSTTSIMATTIYDRVTATSNPNTHDRIINSIKTGAVITNYMGHGSVGVWGDGSNGSLSSIFFQSSDVYNYLTNINQLTFLVTLDCLNGYFAGYGEGLPNSYSGLYNPLSVAESFLKSSTGGAVAAFSPTGQGYTTYHVVLAQALYQQIVTPPSPPPLGLEIKQAETNVLMSVSASQYDLETVSIFVLLGDPATQLALP